MNHLQVAKINKPFTYLALICIFILLIGGGGYLKKLYQQHVYQQQKHYFRQSMLQFLARQDANIEPGAIIFIGDSHIQGLAVSAIDVRGVNFGIGGESSWQLRERISDYTSLKYAKCVFLATGVNDFLHRDAEATMENMQQILNYIGEDVVVIVSEILPLDESVRSRQNLNQEVRMLNQQLTALTESRPKVHIARHDHVFGEDRLKPEYHIGDGLHLNAKGYALWINQIKGYLAQFCEIKQ